MGTSSKESQLIDVVEQRIDFLECVQDSPKDKRTLVEETEFSRSTVDRSVRELEALELLEYDEGRYKPTSCGEFVADTYRQFTDTIEIICRLEPFLRWVSPADLDLDLRLLAGADLYTPEPGDPYAMINHHVQRVKRADTSRCVLPFVGRHAAEAGHENIIDDEGMAELIVEPAVAETLQTRPVYAELIDDLAGTDRFHLSVYDGAFPYAIAIFDNEIVQLAADDSGEPRALLETDAEAVCTWATNKFEMYKQQSEQIM